MTSYGRQTSGGSGLGSRRGPPLASIESLLSFEAKSTPRSEFGHHIAGAPGEMLLLNWSKNNDLLRMLHYYNVQTSLITASSTKPGLKKVTPNVGSKSFL